MVVKKRSRRMEGTPRSKVRSALRQLFLRSRERAACIKAAQYTCTDCGVKQSKAKGREVAVEIHHHEGVLNWNEIFEIIYAQLLCPPEKMVCLCIDCHRRRELGKSHHEILGPAPEGKEKEIL